MTSIQFSENFILTSPEELLRQLSLEPSIDNIFISNPIKLKDKRKYCQFQSWNVSEELKISKNKHKNINQTVSTSLTIKKPKSFLNYSRAKTSIQKDDFLMSEKFNFKNKKKKGSFFTSSFSKTERFEVEDIHSITPVKHSPQFQIQRRKIKAKIRVQTQIFKQKDRRLRLVQSYLQKQKSKILNGMQQTDEFYQPKCSFIQYPVRYTENDKNANNKKSFILSRNSVKQKAKNRRSMIIEKKPVLNKIDTCTIQVKSKHNSRIQSQKIIKNNNKRPFKRFQEFLVALNMC